MRGLRERLDFWHRYGIRGRPRPAHHAFGGGALDDHREQDDPEGRPLQQRPVRDVGRQRQRQGDRNGAPEARPVHDVEPRQGHPGRRAEAVTTVAFDRFVGLISLLLLALLSLAIVTVAASRDDPVDPAPAAAPLSINRGR